MTPVVGADIPWLKEVTGAFGPFSMTFGHWRAGWRLLESVHSAGLEADLRANPAHNRQVTDHHPPIAADAHATPLV